MAVLIIRQKFPELTEESVIDTKYFMIEGFPQMYADVFAEIFADNAGSFLSIQRDLHAFELRYQRETNSCNFGADV